MWKKKSLVIVVLVFQIFKKLQINMGQTLSWYHLFVIFVQQFLLEPKVTTCIDSEYGTVSSKIKNFAMTSVEPPTRKRHAYIFCFVIIPRFLSLHVFKELHLYETAPRWGASKLKHLSHKYLQRHLLFRWVLTWPAIDIYFWMNTIAL